MTNKPRTIPDDLVLYIIVRGDMDSMNPGKAAAQACHAANKFIHVHREDDSVSDQIKFWEDSGTVWQCARQGFGTTIVLQENEESIKEIVQNANDFGFASGLIWDPSYPVRDGSVIHSLHIMTAGYVFGSRKELTKTGINYYHLMP
jgi:peptidyl-tRNA hydrolase